MFEITINDDVYQFNFNMGFMREINKKYTTSANGLTKNIGLQYSAAGLLDGDVEELVNVLFVANSGFSPRVTVAKLDSYIDDPATDIDALFNTVLGFMQTANATRKTVNALIAAVEAEQAKQNS